MFREYEISPWLASAIAALILIAGVLAFGFDWLVPLIVLAGLAVGMGLVVAFLLWLVGPHG
jgi:hypothetical protein